MRLGFSGFLVVYNGLDMKVKRILAERGLAAIANVQSVERKTPGVQCPLCGKMVALTEVSPANPHAMSAAWNSPKSVSDVILFGNLPFRLPL